MVLCKKLLSQPGFEPGTFGLEIQRAIHCATRTMNDRPQFFFKHCISLFMPWPQLVANLATLKV